MFEISPFRVAPGETAHLCLQGIDVERARRLVLTRGPSRRATLAIRVTEGAAFADWSVPMDAIQGLYTATVYGSGGYKQQRRNALMVLDRAHHDGRFENLRQYDSYYYVLDSDGIPMKDMGTDVGFVRHPLVATYFIREHMKSFKEGRGDKYLRRAVDLCQWLLSQISPHPSGAGMIRHPFPLESYHLPSGWISALTQGRVAEVFADTWNLTGQSIYRDAAERVVKALAVPVTEGGLLATDTLGCKTFEEYPTRPATWALNGIGSAIASITMLSRIVPLDYAQALVERVCRSVDAKIPLFDLPDMPGSRVQLTRRYHLSLRVGAFTDRDTVDWSVTAVELHPWLEASVVIREFECGRDECRFELLLDGNRDPFDAASSPETALVIDVKLDQPARLRLAITDPDDGKERLLGETVVAQGHQRARFTFDLHRLMPYGVGRVARFDEEYHNINLYWMFDLSLAGALRATYQTARRWLFSRLTGCGRLPFALTEGQHRALADGRTKLEQAMASIQPDALELARRPAMLANLAAFDEVLGLGSRDLPLEVSHMVPRQCRPSKTELRLYGFGFTPAMVVRARDAAAGSAMPVTLDVIASDEAALALDTRGCAGRTFEIWAELGDAKRSAIERLRVTE